MSQNHQTLPEDAERANHILDELLGPLEMFPDRIHGNLRTGRYRSENELARALAERFGFKPETHERAIHRVRAGVCGERKLDELETFLRSHGPRRTA